MIKPPFFKRFFPVSTRTVTGPQVHQVHVHHGPEDPGGHKKPLLLEPVHKGLIKGLGRVPRRRPAQKTAGCPFLQSPQRVNWLTTRTWPPVSDTDRFSLSSASGKMRNPAILSASQAACSGPSSLLTPKRDHEAGADLAGCLAVHLHPGLAHPLHHRAHVRFIPCGQ